MRQGGETVADGVTRYHAMGCPRVRRPAVTRADASHGATSRWMDELGRVLAVLVGFGTALVFGGAGLFAIAGGCADWDYEPPAGAAELVLLGALAPLIGGCATASTGRARWLGAGLLAMLACGLVVAAIVDR